jgi:hypothetical protein
MEKIERPIENSKGAVGIGRKKNCIARDSKAYSRSLKTGLPKKPTEKYNQATEFWVLLVLIP